jgi:hypothetical protein
MSEDELRTDKTYVARDERRYRQGDLLVKIGWILLVADALLVVFVPVAVRAEGAKSILPWIAASDGIGAIAIIIIGNKLKKRASDPQQGPP